MASEWIKMRKDLRGDPAVLGICHTLELDADTVIGKLHAFWSWADSQTADGNARNVTASWIDVTLVSYQGFAEALVTEGWLRITEAGIAIPNYERHLGESAKQRALTARRVALHRGNAKSVTREEKIREDKKKKDTAGAVSFKTPLPPLVAEDVAVPPQLDTPAVRQALGEWIEYHRKIGKPYRSHLHASRLFDRFKTADEFVDAVNDSIANTYQGLFHAKGGPNGKRKPEPSPGTVFKPGSEIGLF